ncbi:MAG: hypothetical protein KDC44_05520 [Phaeodactylibacter sp.]|nr:hypothetical protein [Phaeodactylibacter sp.]
MALFATLAFLLVTINACEQETPVTTATTTAQSLPALPDTLNAAAADSLLGFFASESQANLVADFFYTEPGRDSTRVISLALNANQEAILFSKLEQALQDTGSAVELHLHLALRTLDHTALSSEDLNLVPLLEIFQDSTTYDGIFYPLHRVESLFLANFEELYAWQDSTSLDCPVDEGCGGEEQVKIGVNCARDMIEDWKDLPVDSILTKLYLEEEDTIPDYRIQYYAYEKGVETMLEYYQNATSNEQDCYFYVHLGLWPSMDPRVPLRTIIHLDDNPMALDQKPDEGGDDSAYFEFAKPCPPYCDTAKVTLYH